MKSVLVPIDGSKASLRALALAVAEVSTGPDASLHLLNVQLPPLHPWPGKLVSPDDIDAQLRRQGMHVLELARSKTYGVSAKVTHHVRVGPPAEEIVRCAEDAGCDFIVMGTRGLGAAAALALGSVATSVVHLARLPVALVK